MESPTPTPTQTPEPTIMPETPTTYPTNNSSTIQNDDDLGALIWVLLILVFLLCAGLVVSGVLHVRKNLLVLQMCN